MLSVAHSVCVPGLSKILVHVEDQVHRAAVQIRHLEQHRPGPVRHEGLRRGVAVAGLQDDLGHCASLLDRRHTGLHCRRPGRDSGDVVGLVHDAECDLGPRRVLGGNLAPQAGQPRVCGPTLTDNRSVLYKTIAP
jgi:hypothetical protein